MLNINISGHQIDINVVLGNSRKSNYIARAYKEFLSKNVNSKIFLVIVKYFRIVERINLVVNLMY